ncbi:MAG: hypothetical protein JNM43_25480 [Planctomycetaceae bacterium]|nr:hypothetical protein [Planctomycetaceae bacterium]
MRSRAIRIAILSILGFMTVSSSPGAADEPEELKKLIANLNSAASGSACDEAAYQLIRYDQQNPGCNLSQHPDASIAMICSCDRMLERWAKGPAPVDRAAEFNRFAGLVTERLQVEPPREWTQTVLSAELSPERVLTMKIRNYRDIVRLDSQSGTSRITLVEANGSLRFDIQGDGHSCGVSRSFAVPREIWNADAPHETSLLNPNPLTVICAESANIICVPGQHGFDQYSQLTSYKVSNDEGDNKNWSITTNLPWQTLMGPIRLGSNKGRISSSTLLIAAQLRVTDKSIVIFLCTEHDFSIEARDLKTGALQNRCSSITPRVPN